MKKVLPLLLLAFLFFAACPLLAQVGIGTTTPNSSAALDITSTSGGLLVPRMSTVQRTTITSPATGMMVYQTDGTAGFYYNSGTPGTPVWVYVQNSGNSNVTLQGNTFNGASQLVQLNGSGQLPSLSGVNLTALNATNLASGTIGTARLGIGSANSNTFLRGDGSWATPPSNGIPLFSSIKNQNANYTVLTTDVLVYSTTSGITYTLPTAAAVGAGKVLYLLCATGSGSQQITFTASGTDHLLVPYLGSVTSVTLAAIACVSDGSHNWICFTEL
jgi:hypothetical protein